MVPVTDGLRKLREVAKSKAQAELAIALGVGQQTVSAYLRRRARPSAIVRDRAERTLGIPRDDWYTVAERRVAYPNEPGATGTDG